MSKKKAHRRTIIPGDIVTSFRTKVQVLSFVPTTELTMILNHVAWWNTRDVVLGLALASTVNVGGDFIYVLVGSACGWVRRHEVRRYIPENGGAAW